MELNINPVSADGLAPQSQGISSCRINKIKKSHFTIHEKSLKSFVQSYFANILSLKRN